MNVAAQLAERLNAKSYQQMDDAELVDLMGRAKGTISRAESDCEAIRAVLLKRHQRKARRKTVELTGHLFRATITYSVRLVLDTDKVKAYLGKKLAKFQNSSPCYTVNVMNRTGVQ